MRLSARKRGYTRRWDKVRAIFLKKNPLCVYCTKLGKTTSATVVDHIKPHCGDQKLFWDMTNWQPLCKKCHDSTKQTEEKRGYNLGCDVDGWPADDNHHWKE